ncbi:T9SS type A sorting domain-containing protein [Fulvivirga lutimaris]|uniref:T9SS type A sorting domain-containing protein n=1 Tax=Fulvivirga lutimaris TaxID=1819566 RepID=UPI0012BCF490|nr:T9SS type A sorting domain-containing protein [Fulvivirga lutimaris]MTI41322.1 T9SS type A sorting domain-containing protein [Fulvivirga lutimaris]
MARLILLLLLTVLIEPLLAQRVSHFSFTPAGSTFKNAAVQGFWNIGEVTKGTATTTNFTISQGYVRGNIVLQVTGDTDLLESQFTIYPNPVVDVVNIRWKRSDNVFYSFKLLDLSGQEVKSVSNLRQNYTDQIDMSGLNNGLYLLIIQQKGAYKPVKLKLLKGINHE